MTPAGALPNWSSSLWPRAPLWADDDQFGNAPAGVHLPPIAKHAKLHAAAQSHAARMARTETMSYTGGSGSSFWDCIQQAGYAGTLPDP